MTLKAPFPYFGGKSKVAPDVWAALGNPAHYIEPFFGSGAVLLDRPEWKADMTETVNDADGYVANVWRAIQYSPQETAKVCDWPVNHADLIARKAKLIREENYLLANLCRDDKWHDVELAGYWIWAASCWIGHGLTRPTAKPHVADAGTGVHRKAHGGIYDWFDALSTRLRRVRVVCGDWTRVCGGEWQSKMGVCGMFFDPPYSVDNRSECYHKEDYDVAHAVRDWCLERGANPDYRIVLAGYFEEHESLLSHGWRVQRWKAHGGYGLRGDGQGKANRHREALFFSPHCIQPNQASLFDGNP